MVFLGGYFYSWRHFRTLGSAEANNNKKRNHQLPLATATVQDSLNSSLIMLVITIANPFVPRSCLSKLPVPRDDPTKRRPGLVSGFLTPWWCSWFLFDKIRKKSVGAKKNAKWHKKIKWFASNWKSKEESKEQESIQSSPRHHMGKWQNTRKHHTQKSQESRWPQGCKEQTIRFDSLRPSQHFFSYVGTGLPGLN